ncbi:hypothetical protein P691DRAFT_773376 [Macrolepiota fuliginosa MF-IS2]|uniref:Uncharacterized protein n=1 Tax=Macrolepiota fuliginosa MF-IS2 TaxID=1400762 RepID=A0A9P5XIT7_9AGAR|nr:hypothetical protein P691DRAFT_773376 [Macrolepiota fuliginosa MF-IS2]
MTFKPEETYIIHNIIDPRPVQRNGPERPLTVVDRLNCYAKWIITGTTTSSDCEQFIIQNAETTCYAHLKQQASQAVTESPNPLTCWKIKVVSRYMYRIYDPTTQLFWTSHSGSDEISLEPFSPGSDQWWAISSEDCI